MPTSPYGFKNDYITGAPPSAADLNRRANILRAQLPGVFEGLGEGVLPVPDETSLLVTYDAGAVYVDIGAAYVRHEDGHLIYVQNLADSPVEGYTPGEVNYIFAVAYLSDNPAVHDSETARLIRHTASDNDSLPGGLLLAEVAIDGTVTMNPDRWIAPQKLALRVAQLEADLGYNPTERAKGTVAARLNLLTGDEGEAGTTVTFLSQLKYSEADPRNAVLVLEEKLAAILAAASDIAQSGGERDSPSETDQIWNWLLGYRRILGILAPNLLRYLPGAGAQPGLHGTSSAPDTEPFDRGGTLPAIPEEREYDSR